MSTLLDYYREIIPDTAAFAAIAKEPLPLSFWVNTLKISVPKLLTLLAQSNIDVTPLPWHSAAFRLKVGKSLGLSWQYRVGLLQIQEEVSMLSGRVLCPSPGERVLDLCAAPGNKTAQMAVSMQNQGMLVANDRQYQRLRAMGQIIKRLGLININMTVYDGRQFPLLPNYFDKVLVDAPCSCEGTFRKNLNKTVYPNTANNRRMASVQIALLKRALTLCRPGGLILYSTCTFAPEENEGVIDCLLRKHADEVEVVPIEVDDFAMSPGITHWQEQRYCSEVALTRRVWPYQNNTGGFYLALLRKRSQLTDRPSTVDVSSALSCNSVESEALAPYFSLIKKRYGFADTILKQFTYSGINGKGFYVRNKDNQLPSLLRSDMSGLLFIKTNSNFPKLSTPSAILLCQYAQQNYVVLTHEQLLKYMNREQFALLDKQTETLTNTGFVIVIYDNVALGSALYFEAYDEMPPRCRSLFPKYL